MGLFRSSFHITTAELEDQAGQLTATLGILGEQRLGNTPFWGRDTHGFGPAKRMRVNLVINAPNVHLGGGFTLLTAVLEALDDSFKACVLLDERMSLPTGLSDNIVLYWTRPTVLGRLLGEWRLRRVASSDDLVLCFGNLPPLFKLPAKVLLFIQNRFQIERRSLRGFPFFSRLRIIFERFWFAWGRRNVTHFIVQTPSMQRTVLDLAGLPSAVLPFTKNPTGYKRAWDPKANPIEPDYDFAYVASGEPHKNHHNLVEAWALLAEDGVHPSLCFTLDNAKYADLCRWIEGKRKGFDLNITNRGILSSEEVQGLYKGIRALIYPSDSESLGLPLIEARCAGVPILASERDYVRDVIDPEQTFDPNSPVSIARAVKRFLGIIEDPLPLMDAKTYLSKIVDIALS
jgi:glycosyltransferase involved in cell wall biosynthesis